ncbi:hypothetical protein [Sphingosinicella humi]|uniref:Uncharacterized protein n=1 Tax=Allosphingosinicella humi TaxID=2068657 RepID=A0A2U2J1C6_9SPHN|nr:hypothetical protein [Sphingosinicella humi]PWG02133.1 hypothetical protein DF286_04060 [Sphingosinicella humi]
MNIVVLGDGTSRTARRMIKFLHAAAGGGAASVAPDLLPAGAIYLEQERLILATTPCGKGVFNEAMLDVATQTGADIILAHQGRYPIPEILDEVTFTALVHVDSDPRIMEDMVLYWLPGDGYWLLPPGPAPFVELNADGSRVSFCSPFVDRLERADGVDAAAAKMIRATRYEEAF